MPQIYIVRHPLTAFNKKHLFQPSSASLSRLGEKQIARIGLFFREIEIDKIYSSDTVRTTRTAHTIAEHQKRQVMVDIFPEINERGYGQFIGKSFKQVTELWPELIDPTWYPINDRIFKDIGGEASAVFFNRVRSFFEEKLAGATSNIVVVSHTLVNRMLLVLFQGKPMSEIANIPQSHACINEVELNSGSARLIRVNYTGHLASNEVWNSKTATAKY